MKINSTRRRRAGRKQRGLQKEQHQRKQHTQAHTHPHTLAQSLSELSLSRENRLCRKHFSAAAPAEIFNAATTTATSARIRAQERNQEPKPRTDRAQTRAKQTRPSPVPSRGFPGTWFQHNSVYQRINGACQWHTYHTHSHTRTPAHTHSHGHMPPEAKGPSCTFPVYCGRQQTVLSSPFPVLTALLSILFSAAQFSLFAIADGSSTLKTNAKFVENTRTHTHTHSTYVFWFRVWFGCGFCAEHKRKVLKLASRPTARQICEAVRVCIGVCVSWCVFVYVGVCVCVAERLRKLL